MTVDEVKSLRDALKGGKNLPLRIYIDNAFAIIDESKRYQFTKWDDNNGVLYSFRLPEITTDYVPDNRGQAVSLFAVPYEFIQAMEAILIPLDSLTDVFDTMTGTGCSMSDEFKSLIKSAYNSVLSHDRHDMRASQIKFDLGDEAADGRDDYYTGHGKYSEPYRETLRYAKRNGTNTTPSDEENPSTQDTDDPGNP